MFFSVLLEELETFKGNINNNINSVIMDSLINIYKNTYINIQIVSLKKSFKKNNLINVNAKCVYTFFDEFK